MGLEPTHSSRCIMCRGSGHVARSAPESHTSRRCPACRGTGQRAVPRCCACGGSGLRPQQQVLRVTVPRGATDGSVLRVRAQGNAGRWGGQTGDLFVKLRVGDNSIQHKPCSQH